MTSRRLLLHGTVFLMTTASVTALPAAAHASTVLQRANADKVIRSHANAMTKRVPAAAPGAVPRVDSLTSACRSFRFMRGRLRDATCKFEITVSDVRGATTIGRRTCGDSTVLLRVGPRSSKPAVVRRTSKLSCRALAPPPVPATTAPAPLPEPAPTPASTTPAPQPVGPVPTLPPAGGTNIAPPVGAPTGPPPGFEPPARSGATTRVAWVDPSERPASGFAGCTGWLVDPWYKRYYMFECRWDRSTAPPGAHLGIFSSELAYFEGYYYGADGRAHFWYAGRP